MLLESPFVHSQFGSDLNHDRRLRGHWGRTQPISCKQKLFEKEIDSGILGGTCYNPADDSEHILEGRGCHVADAKLRLGGQCQHGP